MRALLIQTKTLALVGALAMAIAIASIAYAYWTTTGSGSGSATNASSGGTIVLHATFTGGLAPGGTKTVTYTAANAGTSSLYVKTITPTVSIDATHVTAGCLVGDFTIPATVSTTTVAAGATAAALGTGTLTFADTGINQDGCQGATVSLALASN